MITSLPLGQSYPGPVMCSQPAPKAKPMPLHLRVFLSSPGDVADERALARRLLKDELPYDAFLRDRVTVDVVSWDDPAAPTPMLATLTPQEAVNQFGPKPSDCDIVIVILWSRLGTHLDLRAFRKSNDEPYLSGTEWEYEDACNARPPPDILVYRRTEEPKVGLKDPAREEKVRQYALVEQFFGHFQNPDGSSRKGFTTYNTSTEFHDRLANDLKHLLCNRIGENGTGLAAEAAPLWTDSPYPGLRAFTSEEAAIFFGRGRETDALIARLRDYPHQRFLAVVGASGTGKSSLVRAGLLARLANGAIKGSQHWHVLTFTPGAAGDNPFLALAVELARTLPPSERKPWVQISKAIAEAPQRITAYATMLPVDTVLVLFVDQFEELFTQVAERYRATFIDLLAHAAADQRLRVLATLRTDFQPQVMAEPKLAALFQASAGSFPLGPPGPIALAEMIQKPAERAGLDLEHGLIDEILRDAGSDPGALPLVAFCLEALYRQSPPTQRLTVTAYENLGRLRGAIGRQTNSLLADLQKTNGAALDAAFPQLFRFLVYVDAAGTAIRRRTLRNKLGIEPPMSQLIETLIQGRLLVAENAGSQAIITLAHETLLTTWPDLCRWLVDRI